ncbi:DUF6090 family protein [Namhaeicola litoreus]|uniref:DUF6090 family protein n=1 Tax=Namhaeicola litoreus TaxID=1052145 RepID=A0ABW3Y137_9FLAO
MKIFRQLRHHLLSFDKTGKPFLSPGRYLKYAIGEIVLVVIGILIALQINNWNESRKDKILEMKILNEINTNLKSTIASLNRTIELEETYVDYNFLILDYIDHQKQYDQKLDEAFGMYFWTVSSHPVSAGYDYLKTRGLELIANDSLRIEISLIFENELPVIQSENEKWANNLQQNVSYPYHVEHFIKYYDDSNTEGIEYAKPMDYDSLMKDPKFKSINTEIISNRKWNISTLKNIIIKIQQLMRKIEEEITT